MSVARENAVVASIVKLLKEYGAWFVKTTGVSLVGCPDLLVCYRGHFIALEVKREHNGEYGVTRKQAHEIIRLERAGATACVVASRIEVKRILDVIDLSLGDYSAP